jgi:hypothetical protein
MDQAVRCRAEPAGGGLPRRPGGRGCRAVYPELDRRPGPPECGWLCRDGYAGRAGDSRRPKKASTEGLAGWTLAIAEAATGLSMGIDHDHTAAEVRAVHD